jgi:hypothetical protein
VLKSRKMLPGTSGKDYTQFTFQQPETGEEFELSGAVLKNKLSHVGKRKPSLAHLEGKAEERVLRLFRHGLDRRSVRHAINNPNPNMNLNVGDVLIIAANHGDKSKYKAVLAVPPDRCTLLRCCLSIEEARCSSVDAAADWGCSSYEVEDCLKRWILAEAAPNTINLTNHSL